MAFAINPSHLPYFRDYNRASEWEHAVKPIRGTTIKPLGKRSVKHMRILRYNEGTPEERVACRLYSTDCVTYYKKDDCINTTTWISLPASVKVVPVSLTIKVKRLME